LKKLLIAALAALSVTAASAQVNGFVTGDYIHSTGSDVATQQYEYHIGAFMPTKYGTFDASLVDFQTLVSDVSSSRAGAEVGYSYSYNWEGVRLTGRARAGDASSNWYYTLGAEASYKVDPKVSLYGNYRFRDGMSNSDMTSQNRFGIGVDVDLVKDVVGRIGYNYTNWQSTGFNGVNGAIVIKF
jgi:hypothetical protein